ncbi:MAG: ATP-binding cassette domain-containing protein [Mesorhizobium sp.]|nr:ATP-binding cassette domain-containing protein [bacterium M00.F.Ca.ET.205.01.1.1]TGU55446.1 ATP-binding cassette domain-containing protein [bacterium M00.F.Ca.ET.152.01.1.1]TGV40268.1 ATP-binding cassette domain-containing protein [Mesorhizobium sp. M00.F.Ca.ET.186.01.1.1]TGZ45259.1 ATP-binding cassette domain-containing protein [bacterium M00.F.Ca.ET.162.01.1.1]TJW33443.1 MAG: ATP-binding cassette domain-containing protein [Mesorhizobium sp.]
MSETKPPPLVRTSELSKHYPVGRSPLQRRIVHAVEQVSLEIFPGETLGIVGESGCGKSTLGRCLVRLTDITSGTLEFAGRDITRASQRQLRPVRRQMQMVFQDPSASLNPRRRVGDLLADPFRVHEKLSRSEMADRVEDLLVRVELLPEHAQRFPHEFSGGQRQRIGIARALALRPQLIVADEPVSALDVSIQAQIINLLADLRDALKLTYVFIAHDLSVVRQFSSRVAVMYLGSIVETGPVDAVFSSPRHHYTAALRSAVPVPDVDNRPAQRIVLKGDLPSPLDPPSGCRFHTRCVAATSLCRYERPVLSFVDTNHLVACHHPRAG